jgi:hypothetical protein
VEGHHPHGARRAADEQLDPLAHLLRRLVGEGDGQDLVGLRAPRVQEPCDPVREHARLAGARAGEDEQRTFAVGHGLALRRVEPGEELVDAVGRRLWRHRTAR